MAFPVVYILRRFNTMESNNFHSEISSIFMSMSYEFSWGVRIQDYFRSCQKNYSQRSLKENYKGTIPDRRVHIRAVVRGGAEGALALPDFGVSEKRGQKENPIPTKGQVISEQIKLSYIFQTRYCQDFCPSL